MIDLLSIIRMNMTLQEEKLRTLLLKVQMIIHLGQPFLMMIVDVHMVTNQIQVLVLECQQVMFMELMMMKV